MKRSTGYKSLGQENRYGSHVMENCLSELQNSGSSRNDTTGPNKSTKRKRTNATAGKPAILVIDVTHEPSVSLSASWDGGATLSPHVTHADSDGSDHSPIESDKDTFDSLQRFLLGKPFEESGEAVFVQQQQQQQQEGGKQQPDELTSLSYHEPLDTFESVDGTTANLNTSFSPLQLPTFDTVDNDLISVNVAIKRLNGAYHQITKHLTDVHVSFSCAMIRQWIDKDVESGAASAQTAGSTSSAHLEDRGQQQQKQHQSYARTSTFPPASLFSPNGKGPPSIHQQTTPVIEQLRVGLKLLYQALTNTVLVDPVYSPATLIHAEDTFRPHLILDGQTDYGDLVKSHVLERFRDPAFASLPNRDHAFVCRYVFHSVTHQVYMWCLRLATRQNSTSEFQMLSNKHYCGEAALNRTQQVFEYLTQHADVRQYMHYFTQRCCFFSNIQLLMLHVYFIVIKLRYALSKFRQEHLVEAAALGSIDTYVMVTAVQMRQMLARICLQLDFTTRVRAAYLRLLGSERYMCIMKPIADIAPGILALLDGSEREELQQQQQLYLHGQEQQIPAPYSPPYNARSL